ncbi:MAG: hypothetical protein QF442_01855 [Candidatus Peribacteraceae bacterium]|nr:hypothetical protein [Candidatus Peribacteraceae bacterium]
MSDRFKAIAALAGFSIILALLMQGPQLLHDRHPLSRGIEVRLNDDEEIYLARIQEALTGRPELSAEAFTGHPGLTGTQFALIERLYGQAFSGTDWRAADVLRLMDSLIPVLIFLSLFLFFRLAGFGTAYAFGGAAVFCLLQLFNLNRPIHMRSSFLIMLWTLIALSFGWRGYKWWYVGAGLLLGLLVSVYFWSFMFAWIFWGVLFIWEFGEWLLQRWKEQHKKQSRIKKIMHTALSVFRRKRPEKQRFSILSWHLLGLAGLLGVIAALPAVSSYLTMMEHPLYEYGSFRSGMHPGRAPESWIYSVLFLTMLVGTCVAVFQEYQLLRKYRLAIVSLISGFIYMNQQSVHNITFNFVSHGIFSLLLGACCVVLLAVSIRSKWLLISACAALIYIGGISYDGRSVIGQWTPQDGQYEDQHLIELLPILDDLPRARILSDSVTSRFVSGYTHHDIAYSIYLKNVLMTHMEIASRFCLTQLPLKPEQRVISERRHLVHPDATAAFGGDLRQQEEKMVLSACAELDLSPPLALEAYEISHVLWNKVMEPNWNVRRLRVPLKEVASGELWTLYELK